MPRIDKTNLTCHVAATDDSRPVLHGIHFDQQGSVSADGFRLLMVPYPDGEAPTDLPEGGVTVRLDDALRVARSVPNAIRRRGTTEAPVVALKAADGRVSIAATDGQGTTSLTARAICSTYPNYRAIFPTSEPVFAIGVTPRLLVSAIEQIAAVMKARGWGHAAVRLEFHGESAPIVVEPMHGQPKGLRAAVMPCHVAREPETLADRERRQKHVKTTVYVEA